MMKRIKLHDKQFVPYINRQEIDLAVGKVAEELNSRYRENTTPPLIIAVMNGAYMFCSDLVKKLDFITSIGFVKVSSYSGTERSNNIALDWNNCASVEGRDVIIADEIIDSGCTMAWLKELYISQGAKSVTIATLIYKPHTMVANLTVDAFGIAMEQSAFLVGYGLDYNEEGRTLCEIYILDEDE